MPALNANFPTLLDLAKRTDPDGGIAKVIEILDNVNEFVAFMPFVEGNLPTGHLTTVRTGLPGVAWTGVNEGVTPTKSTTVQVTESTGILEAYGEVDDKLVKIAKDKSAFRLSEEKPQIESFAQEIARALIYENSVINPKRFTGLAPRFNSRSTAVAACAENVIHGGGAGTDNTSIWLLVAGENTVHGLVPQGHTAGLEVTDKGKTTKETTGGVAGSLSEVWRTHYIQHAGLVVRDWRYVVRIANIDKSLLTPDAATGANLPRLIYQALNLVPNLSSGQPLLLMSRNTRTILGQQVAEGTKSSSLTVDDVGGRMVTKFQGVPIARTDALAADEALVP
jgi:hypothetical protein